MDFGVLSDFVTTHWAEVLGYLGASLVILAQSRKRMLTLRCLGITANVAFIVYGVVAEVFPQVALHAVLLPLNVYRLQELVRHVQTAKYATAMQLSVEWVRPFVSRVSVSAGDIIFHKGDAADALYITKSGGFRLNEIGKAVALGDVIGEVGFFTPDKTRTLTFECVEDGEVLRLPYHRLA